MTTDISGIFKIFSKFFNPKLVKELKYSSKSETIVLKTNEDVEKLPLNAYKFLDIDEANYIEEFIGIKNIGDASKFNNLKTREKLEGQLNSIKNKYPTLEKNLDKAITISSIIVNFKDKISDFVKKPQKVVVVGLENAGKTAIFSKFGGKLGIKDLVDLKPTKGVIRQNIKDFEGLNLDLFIWDFGGQKQYRTKYIKSPAQYFFKIDVLMYVIDIQDSARFESSFEYFEQILDVLMKLEENPHIVIFIHKFDDDLKDDPVIQLNAEFLKVNFKEFFENNAHDFDYELYFTSIYSMISNEPKFSKFLKSVIKTYSLNDPLIRKVDGLGNILEETVNAIIKLSRSMSSQLISIEDRLIAIEDNFYSNGENPKIKLPAQSTRTKALNELKDIFVRKKDLDK